MFAHTSRYYPLETVIHRAPDGREIPYKRRRFLPQGSTLQVIATVTVADGDRLDRITARTLGDPEAFWQIADANDAMNPVDLTARLGRVLRIPMPQAAG